MSEVRWERMFPDQLEAAFAARPLVYFTYGLCEPHGPQNAVGLDALKAHAIACAAARAHGGIVAPPNYWHIHEIGGYGAWAARTVGEVDRAWLTAVPPWVHFKNVCYHIRAADVLGFHAAILITGHYGPNWRDLKTLVELIQPNVGVRLYGLPDFEANQPGFDENGGSGDHAGRVETSLLWALEPSCVDVTRLPAPAEPGPHFAMGVDAAQAHRRVGERMVADEVKWLIAKADELLADVEELWDRQVRPQLKEFQSMQPRFDERGFVPRDSRWFANSEIPDRS
jgi:creatinine amidohydrolase/Fe(II)-dependent formamide hydrolase-like protein